MRSIGVLALRLRFGSLDPRWPRTSWTYLLTIPLDLLPAPSPGPPPGPPTSSRTSSRLPPIPPGRPPGLPPGPARGRPVSLSRIKMAPRWPLIFLHKNQLFFNTTSGETSIVSGNLCPVQFLVKNRRIFDRKRKYISKCKRKTCLNSRNAAIVSGNSSRNPQNHLEHVY